MTRSNNPFTVILLLATFVLAILSFFSAPATLGREGATIEERLDKIEQRLDDLEQVVNDDPMYPKRTLAARVDALEDSFEKFDKAGQADAKIDQRGFDDLEKHLDQQTKTTDALVRRVADMEKNPPGEDDARRELQAQRRQIDQLDDVVQSLKQRIERLEQKR